MSGTSRAAAAPLVSIVMATYGRPEVLRWAIESVRRQTLTDWELLVVGDACDNTTAELVLAQADQDSRIRFINLQTNYGEQSGPNNVGVARSTGRYIAFLNQDDLWFEDHLAQLVDWLEASGSDLIYGLSAHFRPGSPADLAQEHWRLHVCGLGHAGRYDPVSTFSPASAWLMSRRVPDLIQAWRPALECRTESSQDYLFRAWRQGLRLRSCPVLTTLVFSSGARVDSYRTAADHEQAFFAQALREWPNLRAILTARADLGGGPAWSGWRWSLWRVLAHTGLHPRAWQLHPSGRREATGQYIQRLRINRGLSALPAHTIPATIKEQAALLLCDYSPGTRIDFSDQGTAHRYQGQGWLVPEPQGAWTTAPLARLLLRLQTPRPARAQLCLTLRPFVTRRHRMQRLVVRANGHVVHEEALQGKHERELRIPLSGEMLDQSPLVVDLNLPDTVSPAKVKWRSTDRRPLGILVHSLTVEAM